MAISHWTLAAERRFQTASETPRHTKRGPRLLCSHMPMSGTDSDESGGNAFGHENGGAKLVHGGGGIVLLRAA